MTDASLPVSALVLIPIGAAALGAASGPVTEKFRSDSESRNRAADRAAVAKARSDETQQATIVQLLAAMNALGRLPTVLCGRRSTRSGRPRRHSAKLSTSPMLFGFSLLTKRQGG